MGAAARKSFCAPLLVRSSTLAVAPAHKRMHFKYVFAAFQAGVVTSRRFLVIDEADRMLAQSYHNWVSRVYESIFPVSVPADASMYTVRRRPELGESLADSTSAWSAQATATHLLDSDETIAAMFAGMLRVVKVLKCAAKTAASVSTAEA